MAQYSTKKLIKVKYKQTTQKRNHFNQFYLVFGFNNRLNVRRPAAAIEHTNKQTKWRGGGWGGRKQYYSHRLTISCE